jgi:mycothiol system anti-sigma-R factor
MTREYHMNCNDTLSRLHTYVDRELSPKEMAEVRSHLDGCPPCAQHFTFEEHVKRLVHSKACPERAPEQLIRRILSNLR